MPAKKMLPNAKPQMQREEIEKLLENFNVSQFKVIDIGFRGYYLQTMGVAGKNDIGIYDDAKFIIAPDAFQSFNANTDPSLSRPGIAVLKPHAKINPDGTLTVYNRDPYLYKKGKHGISKPGGGYPALRPATAGEKLPVTRDGKDSVGIAINIHKGSVYSTSSEGCQTIHPTQWNDFITLAYLLMVRHKQNVMPYILIEY